MKICFENKMAYLRLKLFDVFLVITFVSYAYVFIGLNKHLQSIFHTVHTKKFSEFYIVDFLNLSKSRVIRLMLSTQIFFLTKQNIKIH